MQQGGEQRPERKSEEVSTVVSGVLNETLTDLIEALDGGRAVLASDFNATMTMTEERRVGEERQWETLRGGDHWEAIGGLCVKKKSV